MSTSESVLKAASTTAPILAYRNVFAVMGNLYCRTFHRTISRPVNGKYQCWKCLRQFELMW